jgi:predicted lipid-binding transport protein (Tim44 family)
MRASIIARSKGRVVLSLALAVGFAWPVGAAAQTQSTPPSLAEIAKKEAERRKTTKDAKKVITTKDLPESARKPASAPATSAERGQSGGDQKPAPGAEISSGSAPSGGQGDEAAWRARITQAREALRRNETFLEALQTRVNALGNDFRNSGDSAQQAKLTQDRLKALEDLERVKADVELSKKQIGDIEEEARKAGVPPGWVR